MSEPSRRGPLTGIRVVEFAAGVLGPLAGAYLAEMGAEVLKVEPPEGDASRHVRGKGNTTPAETPGPMWVMGSRGKKSITIDAFGERGRVVLAALVDSADVVLTNYRPEALATMGLAEPTLRARNPRLVYAAATGWGRHGADADRMMVDGAAQARAGLASVTGAAGGPAGMVGVVVADAAGAMQLALGVVTALLARERHGVGQRVDTSAFGTQLWLQSWELTHAAMTGFEVTRCGPHHANFGSSYGIFEAADGASLFIGHITDDEDWRAFAAFAGEPELAADERWATTTRRLGVDPRSQPADDSELQRRVEAIVRSRPLDEWIEFLGSREKIIFEPVRSHLEVLADPQVAANDYTVEIELPGVGATRVLGNLVALDVTPGSVRDRPPAVGEHNAEVFGSLGLSDDEIDAIDGETRAAVAGRMGRLKVPPPQPVE